MTRIGKNLVLRPPASGDLEKGTVYARIRVGGRLVKIKSPVQGKSSAGFAGAWRLVDGVPQATNTTIKWCRRLENDIRLGKHEAALTQKRSTAPTAQRLIEAYREIAGEQYAETGTPRPATVANNVAKLKAFVRALGLPITSTVENLNEQAVREWLRLRVNGAPQPEQARARYSAWRTLSQVRSVWATWTLPEYKRRHITIPAELTNWPRPPTGAATSQQYMDPPDALKQRTIAAYGVLEQENPALWLAATLMLMFAMRPIDAKNLTWDAFRLRDGRWWLGYRPSKTAGRARDDRTVDIPLASNFYDRMRRANPTDGHVVPADTTTRRDNIFKRDLNAWMRSVGWDRQQYTKGAYELRRLCISAALNAVGIEWASQIAGDNPETVRRHYATMYRRNMPTVNPVSTIQALADTQDHS